MRLTIRLRIRAIECLFRMCVCLLGDDAWWLEDALHAEVMESSFHYFAEWQRDHHSFHFSFERCRRSTRDADASDTSLWVTK